MPEKLTFWFDFASTYSYLSAMRIMPLAQAAGVQVIWHPFLLGPIFGAQGWTTSPFNLYPAKGRYMWRDMERRSAALSVPLVRPDPFPQNSLLAARVAVAALSHDPGPGAAFCRAVFAAQFGQGQPIDAAETLVPALHTAGLPEEVLAQASTQPIKDALRASVEVAQAAGIFGAPSFTVGEELYWGDDRLEEALVFASGSGRNT